MSGLAVPVRSNEGQGERLEARIARRLVFHRHVVRARIVVRVRIMPLTADGVANQGIADRLDTSKTSRRAIRRGAFTSIGVLLQALQRLLDSWNGDCKPFVWVAAAEEIQQRCTVTVPVRRCTSNVVGTSARQLPKAAGDPA
jgi:hypothetical protein